MENLYWKVFSEEIPKMVERGEIKAPFLLIPTIIILYIASGIFLARGWIRLRRVIQAISFFCLGVIFLQCLCLSKDIVISIKDIARGNIALAFAHLWFPLLAVLSALLLGRRLYCYWLCPLGLLQDVAGKANLCARSRRISYVALIAMAVIIGLLILLFHPLNFIMGAGAWLGFLLIIVSILTFKYPARQFGWVKYIVLGCWIALAIFVKVPGPWCVIGKANLAFSAIIPFFSVLLISLVIPRAWCQFICSDGALLQLFQSIGRRKTLTLILLISLVPSLVSACGGKEEGTFGSFICRCLKAWRLQGVEFMIELPNQSIVAGSPFPAIITAKKDGGQYEFSGEMCLHDSSNTIEPKKITLQDGVWMGTLTITKAGTTTIIASYYKMIDSKSKPLYILPSLPAKFLFQPSNPVEAEPKGSITIMAKLLDEYGNPIPQVECKLSVLRFSGVPGFLSTSTTTTDEDGIIQAYYTLPSKYHTARVKIKKIGTPAISALSGTITTKFKEESR